VDTSRRDNDIIIDLSENKIERVLFPDPISEKAKFLIILKKNPIICDCFATEIKQLIEQKTNTENTILVDFNLDDIVCPKKQESTGNILCRIIMSSPIRTVQ